MLQDVRYTVRAMARQPSFAAGTILVLALAIGVNTAVFSLINALLLRPLPVRAPHEIAFVYNSSERSSFPYVHYQQLNARADVFAGLAARGSDLGRMRVGADVLPLSGEAVSANYFAVLGINPAIGRGFAPNEESSASAPVTVISDALWKSQFGGDPQVLGRSLRIDVGGLSPSRYSGWRDYTIVGVMPPAFTGTGSPWQPAQYWVLLAQRAEDLRVVRPRERLATRPVVPVGRLKAGVSLAAARAAVGAAGRDILRTSEFRAHTPDETFVVVTSRRIRLPFAGAYVMDVPRITATLGAVASLLLIIAAANLAGMLLARGVSRRNEIAVRLSLGISRARLLRQLLAESVLVAIAAGAAGLVLARLLVAAALNGLPSQLSGNGVLLAVDAPIDLRVVAFAFASGLLTALVVGMAPVLQALRVDLLAALAGTNSTTGRSRTRLRRLVLVPQVALSLVLLLVTGVFVRALLRLELAHPGYDAEHVVAVQVQLPQRALDTPRQRADEGATLRVIHSRVLDRLAGVAGVSTAALTFGSLDFLPLAIMSTSIIARSDYDTTRQYRGVTMGYASADYFRTLGIPLLRGRFFDARDRNAGVNTVIVSERMAAEIWPNQEIVGQQIARHAAGSPYPIEWLTVVGVVGSVTGPAEEWPRPVFYVPIESEPLMGTMFLARGAGNAAELVAAAKTAIAAAEPSIVVAQARPLAEMVDTVRYPRRFSAGLLSASGLAALVLAAIGVFALMSYAVAQRIGEIGVRMVLGAQRADVLRLILRDGAAVLMSGIVLGFALAFAALRYASHAIVPLPDVDAITFVTVPLLLAAVVLAACYFPARRAANVDPLVVLRRA